MYSTNAKIVKAGGEKPDEFEQSISQVRDILFTSKHDQSINASINQSVNQPVSQPAEKRNGRV